MRAVSEAPPPWCEPRVAALGGSLDRSRAWGGLTDVSFQVVGGENKMQSFLFLIKYLAGSQFAGSSSPCVCRNLGPSSWPSKNQVQHRGEYTGQYATMIRKFDTIDNSSDWYVDIDVNKCIFLDPLFYCIVRNDENNKKLTITVFGRTRWSFFPFSKWVLNFTRIKALSSQPG